MRARDAARLYNAGYAPQVWLTRAVEPTASLQKMHIAYIGEDFFNTQSFDARRVPIECNPCTVSKPINNTLMKSLRLRPELERERGGAGDYRNDQVHTRRVRRYGGNSRVGRGELLCAPLKPIRLRLAIGGARRAISLDVVREILGLLNAWAGTASASFAMMRTQKNRNFLRRGDALPSGISGTCGRSLPSKAANGFSTNSARAFSPQIAY